MTLVKLFLLPFAGGNKNCYKIFSTFLPEHIALHPVELPGRGARSGEPLLTSLEELVEDIYQQVSDRLAPPYAIYGHSMGAVLGYLLTKKILSHNKPPPVQLFFTGKGGPSCGYGYHGLHQLPREQFIEKVSVFGGLPGELLNNRKLLLIWEPILRADFQAVERYSYQQTAPFDIPVTVGIGKGDTVSTAQAGEWEKETSAGFDLLKFPGNHFFIFESTEKLMQVIGRKLK